MLLEGDVSYGIDGVVCWGTGMGIVTARCIMGGPEGLVDVYPVAAG
jgi:hypothetical protein